MEKRQLVAIKKNGKEQRVLNVSYEKVVRDFDFLGQQKQHELDAT